MPTIEQRNRNTRYLMSFLSVFLFTLMLGQATIYNLVLNYNHTVFPTNWYIFILTCTIFILFVGIYLCIRIIRDTYADFIF